MNLYSDEYGEAVFCEGAKRLRGRGGETGEA
jgi:hypothetical protein